MVILLSIPFQLNSQTNSDGSSPQFLFQEFTSGVVRMKSGRSQAAILNYNTVSEKMVYEKDDKLYDMMNLEMIDTISIQNRKFVPAGGVFYEVLLAAPVSLFIQYMGKLIPPGTPAGYGGTSQVSNTTLLSSVQLSGGYYNLQLPADYLVKTDPVYWIRIENKMMRFTNERQFLKLFAEKEKELKLFIKQNRTKFDRKSSMVKLIEYLNENIKR